jgi:hypothetical protein
LTHAGSFYGVRRPDPIFQALRLLQQRDGQAQQILLQQVGPSTYEGQCLKTIAARYGVAESLILPGVVPHRHSLELLMGSDILLIVGFTGDGAGLQVPGKFYEYLATGHPILALAPRDSAIADVMRKIPKCGEVCDPQDPEQIATALLQMTQTRSAASPSPQVAELDPFRCRFARPQQVGQIAALLGKKHGSRGEACSEKAPKVMGRDRGQVYANWIDASGVAFG